MQNVRIFACICMLQKKEKKLQPIKTPLSSDFYRQDLFYGHTK